MKDYAGMAASLYDGGWRSEDKDHLIEQFGFSEYEAEEICYWLKEFELDRIYNYDGNSSHLW